MDDSTLIGDTIYGVKSGANMIRWWLYIYTPDVDMKFRDLMTENLLNELKSIEFKMRVLEGLLEMERPNPKTAHKEFFAGRSRILTAFAKETFESMKISKREQFSNAMTFNNDLYWLAKYVETYVKIFDSILCVQGKEAFKMQHDFEESVYPILTLFSVLHYQLYLDIKKIQINLITFECDDCDEYKECGCCTKLNRSYCCHHERRCKKLNRIIIKKIGPVFNLCRYKKIE